MAGMLTGFLVPGSRETMVNWHVNKTSSGLTVSPSFGDASAVLEIGDLCQGMLDVNAVTCGCDCRDSVAGMLVCNDTTYWSVSRSSTSVGAEGTYSMHQGP
ncbi:hypothetical protein KCU87_g64, partial [Aureobasidium melanogenum]